MKLNWIWNLKLNLKQLLLLGWCSANLVSGAFDDIFAFSEEIREYPADLLQPKLFGQ